MSASGGTVSGCCGCHGVRPRMRADDRSRSSRALMPGVARARGSFLRQSSGIRRSNAVLLAAYIDDSRVCVGLQKAGSTLRSSRAVPHPSTNRALRRLTSEVGRDPVHSTRYGRQRSRTMLSMQRAVLGGPFVRVANCWLDLVCLLVSKRYANTPVVQCAWNATVSMLNAARLSPPSRRLAGGFRQRRCLAPCVCVSSWVGTCVGWLVG